CPACSATCTPSLHDALPIFGFRHYPVPPVCLVPLVDLLLLLLLAVLLLLFLPECLEYLVRLADLLLQLDRSDRWGPGHLDHLWRSEEYTSELQSREKLVCCL